jgi:hypothetical protein
MIELFGWGKKDDEPVQDAVNSDSVQPDESKPASLMARLNDPVIMSDAAKEVGLDPNWKGNMAEEPEKKAESVE